MDKKSPSSKPDTISRLRLLRREIRNDDWTTQGDWWFKGTTTIDNLTAGNIGQFTSGGIHFPDDVKATFGNTVDNPDMWIYMDSIEHVPKIMWPSPMDPVGLWFGLQEHYNIPFNTFCPSIFPEGDGALCFATWKVEIRAEGNTKLYFYPEGFNPGVWPTAFIDVGTVWCNIMAYDATMTIDVQDAGMGGGDLKLGAQGAGKKIMLNPTGRDVDISMKVNVFYLDASTERIGLKISAPDELLHLYGGNIKVENGSVLATDGVAVNDESKIRFDGVAGDSYWIYSAADEMELWVDGEKQLNASSSLITIGQVGNITLGDSTVRVMRPQVDTKINLGSPTYRFNDGYFAGDVVIEGTLTANVPGIMVRKKLLASDFVAVHNYSNVRPTDIQGKKWYTYYTPFDFTGFVEIPYGMKATAVCVYGEDVVNTVTVYECWINNSGSASKGSGVVGTPIDITDVNYSSTNYLTIAVACGAADTDEIYGGYVDFEAI